MKMTTFLFFSLFLQLFTFTLTSANAQTAPLHHWVLGEAVGETVAYDTGSGTHHHLTLAGNASFLGAGAGGGVLLPNVNPTGYQATGDSFLDFGNNFAFAATEGFTFAAFVRVDSYDRFGTILFLREGSNANSIKLSPYYRGRRARFEVRAGGTGKSFYTPDGTADPDDCFFPPAGQWGHVAATATAADPSTYRLYHNGTTQDNWSGTIDVNNNNLIAPNPNATTYTYAYLGQSWNNKGFDAFFDGALRDVRLYARALAAAEVGALANPVSPSSSASVSPSQSPSASPTTAWKEPLSTSTCHKYCRFLTCEEFMREYSQYGLTCAGCPEVPPEDNWNWVVDEAIKIYGDGTDVSTNAQTFYAVTMALNQNSEMFCGKMNGTNYLITDRCSWSNYKAFCPNHCGVIKNTTYPYCPGSAWERYSTSVYAPSPIPLCQVNALQAGNSCTRHGIEANLNQAARLSGDPVLGKKEALESRERLEESPFGIDTAHLIMKMVVDTIQQTI